MTSNFNTNAAVKLLKKYHAISHKKCHKKSHKAAHDVNKQDAKRMCKMIISDLREYKRMFPVEYKLETLFM